MLTGLGLHDANQQHHVVRPPSNLKAVGCGQLWADIWILKRSAGRQHEVRHETGPCNSFYFPLFIF